MENNFSIRLKEILGESDIRPFARECGINETSIRNYLKGTEPTLGNLIKIAAAGNVSVGWLAAGEGGQIESDMIAASTEPGSGDVLDLSPLPITMRSEIRKLLIKATDIIASTDQDRQTLINTINSLYRSFRKEQEIADYKKKTSNQDKRLATLEREMAQLTPIKEKKDTAS